MNDWEIETLIEEKSKGTSQLLVLEHHRQLSPTETLITMIDLGIVANYDDDADQILVSKNSTIPGSHTSNYGDKSSDNNAEVRLHHCVPQLWWQLPQSTTTTSTVCLRCDNCREWLFYDDTRLFKKHLWISFESIFKQVSHASFLWFSTFFLLVGRKRIRSKCQRLGRPLKQESIWVTKWLM